MAKSDIQRFLEEEQERQGRKQELIQGLLRERDEKMAEYDEQLGLLGYKADLVGRTSSAKKEGGKRERKAGAVCTICNFATNPPHDGRLKAHRDQGDKKKPLTDNQLEAAGLARA